MLDASVFNPARTAMTREIMATLAPILLPEVVEELEDLKRKPELAEVRDIVFLGNGEPRKFLGDRLGVLRRYPRFAGRHLNMLRMRRGLIERACDWIERDTGSRPHGPRRGSLITEMIQGGISSATIALANKEWNPERTADEVLALFAVLSPIVTGRDCFLLTADRDVVEQTRRLIDLLYNDYGAFLICQDYLNNAERYSHRHAYESQLFIGSAEAVGRDRHPSYLFPPMKLIVTCATTVVDVNTMHGWTWIGARNMEAAVSFQDADPLARRGDPGDGRAILFSPPSEKRDEKRCRNVSHHFVLGTPVDLKLSNDAYGPIPLFDLVRTAIEMRESPVRKQRIVSPFDHAQQRLRDRMESQLRRRQ